MKPKKNTKNQHITKETAMEREGWTARKRMKANE